MGIAPELPDWLPILRAADKLHCRPWELIETEVPKRVWVWWALALAEADATHQDAMNEKQSSERRAGNRKAIGSR